MEAMVLVSSWVACLQLMAMVMAMTSNIPVCFIESWAFYRHEITTIRQFSQYTGLLGMYSGNRFKKIVLVLGNQPVPGPMINFFRRNRRQLARENQFSKYFRYAFGEVVLIMLGIFMALQLQNWNEERKQEIEFHVILEQIYNAVFYDVDKFKSQIGNMTYQIEVLDLILNTPDSIPLEVLPYYLYSPGFDNFKTYQSDVFFYAGDLSSDYQDAERNELIKQITGYINLTRSEGNSTFDIDADRLSNFLMQENLAYPEIDRIDLNKGWVAEPSPHYYSEARLTQLNEDLKTPKYQSFFKTYRSQKIAYRNGARAKLNYGNAILDLIKNYNPDVRVIYSNVGVIGTALDGYDDVGGRSTPMQLTDAENSIWEAELYLKTGTVKFRCNDSWLRNWGGQPGEDNYLVGPAMPDGNNIAVEAGNYHIKLDLSSYTYEFTRLD
jgi:hypothetical protein